MKKFTHHQLIKRAENALKELELSLVTQADKLRMVKVYKGIHALDDENADIKAALEELVEKYKVVTAQPTPTRGELVQALDCLLNALRGLYKKEEDDDQRQGERGSSVVRG
jgi:hypothetical protein